MKKRFWYVLLVCTLLFGSLGAYPVNADSIITNGPYGGAIAQLMNDPANVNGIYAVARQVGLFYSADNGSHWSLLFSGIGSEGNFALDAADPLQIYAVREGYGIYRSQDKGSTWTHLPWPEEFEMVNNTRVFADPLVTDRVYAAFWRADPALGGLYVSHNSGDSWTKISSSPVATDAKINALAFSTNNPLVLYAGTDDGKLYRSADRGGLWVEQDFPLGHISKLVYAEDGTLFVIGSGEGVSLPAVMCSEDTPTGIPTLDCYVGETTEPNYLVLDSISEINTNRNQITDLKFNSATDMLVSTGYKAARSLDGGATWSFYTDVNSPSQPLSVLYDPAQPATVWVGNDQGLRQTTQGLAAGVVNSAAAWTERDEGLAGVVPTFINAAPSDSQVLYVNSSSGLYRTADGAQSWTRLPTYCDGDDWCYMLNTPFAVDPGDADTLVQAAWQQTVHLSDDGGQTWTLSSELPQPTTLPGLDAEKYVIAIHALVAIPGEPAAYVAAAAFHNPAKTDYKRYDGGGIYRSVDGGVTWTLQYETASAAITSLASDPNNPQRVFAGLCTLDVAHDGACLLGGMLTSGDRGEGWEPLTPESSLLQAVGDASVIGVRPTDGRLYVAYGNGLIWLASGGSEWADWGGALPVGVPINQILFDPMPAKAGNVMYAATSEGLFVSSTAGENFERFPDDNLGHANTTVLAATREVNVNAVLFVGTAGGQFGSQGLTTLNAANLQAETQIQAGVYRIQSPEHFSVFLPFTNK